MLLWTWKTIYVIHIVVTTINMDLDDDLCHPYRVYINRYLYIMLLWIWMMIYVTTKYTFIICY